MLLVSSSTCPSARRGTVDTVDTRGRYCGVSVSGQESRYAAQSEPGAGHGHSHHYNNVVSVTVAVLVCDNIIISV